MVTYKDLLDALNKLSEDLLNKPLIVLSGASGLTHYGRLRLVKGASQDQWSGDLLEAPSPVIYIDSF